MKKKTNRLLSILLCCVMLIGLLPTTALAANNFVDFLTTNLNVEFAETGETGFMRVNLFGNGKVSKLPVVYRTDSLDYAFDGWYTAKEGGEKVTEETVFNDYTILYDRWTEETFDSNKIISSITIPNAALTNGNTENDYIDASQAVSATGVENSKVYAVYNGLNAYGSQVTGAETIDTSNDYSVVTTITLKDGYRFASDIIVTAENGVRAGVKYYAVVDGGAVLTNSWNSLATRMEVCINFPAGGNNVGFTTEPVGGTVNESEQYNFTWEVSGQPTAAELQVKNGNNWATADNLNINQPSGTIAAQTGTKTYRILVTYGNSGSIYSNEFNVTWLSAVQNSFSMSPVSGSVKNGTDYYYTWACVRTPATATLQIKNGDSWNDLGQATDRKITYIDDYANTTQTFRIKATMAGGSDFYSEEFTVTYKSTPLFSVQPADGKVAIGEAYTVKYTVDKADGDGDFVGNYSLVQKKKNGEGWDNVSTSVYFTEAEIPAQQSAITETYRVGIKIGSNDLLYSDEFTVQWIDDYTFELDQNSLAWGSIAKSDYYGEYAKIIKVMPTGTKTYTDDTLKYDTPNNFEVNKWKSPSGYYLLTFTPKASLDAGDYNENINIWATSNGNDEIGKTSVALSITIEAPTYTVSFDKNGGSGSMASVYNVSGSYELPTCAFTAPDGQEFKAWQVNGGKEKNASETITVTGNTVLTALWKDLPVVSGYTITFAAGEGGSSTMDPVTGASGTYHLPACTFTAPNGKQFKAWQVGNQELQPGQTITVTTDTTVTALWQDIPASYWTVNFSSANVCGVSGNFSTTKYVEQGQAMTDIIVTANDGYYFPDNLTPDVQGDGVTATRNSYTQVTISGTPTSNVTVQFGPNTKQKEATPTSVTFEATDSDKGNLTNLENGVSYSVTGAATAEFTASGTTHELTNVVQGTLNIVKKATDPNTKLDSDAAFLTVGKHSTVPNCNGYGCSNDSNNDGKITNVNTDMEYQKDGANSWTTGNGGDVTGLEPGTYYVRYKASNNNLAGDAKTINIAAYGAAQLTGTVEITGDAKYGSTLTAIVTNSNNTGVLSYQWVRNQSNISGVNSETYTLVEADIGSTIKVVVTSSVQSENITSEATEIVQKADVPVAPTGLAGVAPTTDGGSNGKITGTTDTMEYSTDSSFTNPNGTACSATETTGLSAGTYYVRVKETNTHKAGANATVTIPAYSATPIYSISLDATGTHTFSAATVGYAAQTAKTVTVSNTGNSATGALTVALSGNDAGSFTLNKNSIDDIAVGGNNTFTVVPNTGLSAGTYTATVTVSGGNSITASFDVSFTVNAATPTYGIALSPSGTQTFAAATVGYGAQSAKTVTVSNTGTGATGALTVALSGNNANSFELNKTSIADIAVSGSDTFTVVPKTGLSAGTYTATVTVSGSNSITASFNVSFTVNSGGNGGNGGNGGGGGYVPATYSVTVDKADNGSVSVSPKSASKGSTITVTVDPDKGYTLETLSVTDKNGKEIELTNKGDGKYTFTMPASKVTVKATFMEDNTMLNYFVDVFATDYYYDAVLWAVEEGITNGTSATTFGPGETCTRAQMATFLWRAAGSPDPVGSSNPFADVSEDTYYAKAVQWAYEQGITGGTSATTYSPDAPCTRGQMVTFLHRVAGTPNTGNDTNPFTDVPDTYYTEAVQWAYEQDITNGTSATTFSPDEICSRGQMVTFLYRFFVK